MMVIRIRPTTSGILLNTAYIRTLLPEIPAAPDDALRRDARRLEDLWKGVYGEPAAITSYGADFATVYRALMDTKLAPLKEPDGPRHRAVHCGG